MVLFWAAGGERDDEAHRPRRVVERVGRTARDEKRQQQGQQARCLDTKTHHDVSPPEPQDG